MNDTAWVTLATNDSYALGALVVANSLKNVHTVHDLAILITPGVSLSMKNELNRVFHFVKEVDVFDSRDETNLKLLARPELGITFTKIQAWRLTQYKKCVFLDADVLVVQNCDELFDRKELSAAPDAGWPDCFNSGVFVFTPSISTYNDIVDFALVNGSFDGGDQGLLNMYFSNWSAESEKRLSFLYNMCSTSTYTYLPALKQFGSKVKIIHFIGTSKPWIQHFDARTNTVSSATGENMGAFYNLWWEVFMSHVQPTLTTEMYGLARALVQLPLGDTISAEQLAYEDHIHRQKWEEGHIDYLGKDSWDNIWNKISETIEPVKSAEASLPTLKSTAGGSQISPNVASESQSQQNQEENPVRIDIVPPTPPVESQLATLSSDSPISTSDRTEKATPSTTATSPQSISTDSQTTPAVPVSMTTDSLIAATPVSTTTDSPIAHPTATPVSTTTDSSIAPPVATPAVSATTDSPIAPPAATPAVSATTDSPIAPPAATSLETVAQAPLTTKTPSSTSVTPVDSTSSSEILGNVTSEMEKIEISSSIPAPSETSIATENPPIPPKRKGSKDTQKGKN